MSIHDQVLFTYPKLKKTSKSIADYFLSNPGDFLHSNAQDLGKLTQTSAASVIRFCQRLDFKGFKDFQLQLAQDLSQNINPSFDTIVANDDTPQIVLAKLIENLRQNLEAIAKSANETALNQAVSLLKSAQGIYLEGIAASGLPAQDLYYKLIRIGRKAYYSADAHIALEQSFYTSNKDVMLAFSYSGKTKEVILAAKQAKKNKTPIIAITRHKTSALSKLADVILDLPTNEQLLRVGAIDSLFGEMIISSLLYLSLVSQNLPTLENNMKATSKLTNKLKENN